MNLFSSFEKMIFLLLDFVVLICTLQFKFIRFKPACFPLFNSLNVNVFFSFGKMTFLSLGFVVLMCAPSLVAGKDVRKNLVLDFFEVSGLIKLFNTLG